MRNRNKKKIVKNLDKEEEETLKQRYFILENSTVYIKLGHSTEGKRYQTDYRG